MPLIAVINLEAMILQYLRSLFFLMDLCFEQNTPEDRLGIACSVTLSWMAKGAAILSIGKTNIHSIYLLELVPAKYSFPAVFWRFGTWIIAPEFLAFSIARERALGPALKAIVLQDQQHWRYLDWHLHRILNILTSFLEIRGLEIMQYFRSKLV